MEVPGKTVSQIKAKFVQVDIKVIQKLYMLEFLEFSFFFNFTAVRNFKFCQELRP